MVNAYPLEPIKVPTMAELMREMMMGHYGLVMCDTVGGLFSVKIHGKHLKTGTVMEASRIRGGGFSPMITVSGSGSGSGPKLE